MFPITDPTRDENRKRSGSNTQAMDSSRTKTRAIDNRRAQQTFRGRSSNVWLSCTHFPQTHTLWESARTSPKEEKKEFDDSTVRIDDRLLNLSSRQNCSFLQFYWHYLSFPHHETTTRSEKDNNVTGANKNSKFHHLLFSSFSSRWQKMTRPKKG